MITNIFMANKTAEHKKLKILAAADIHGSKDIAEKLAAKAEKNNVDLVILAGDIHGMFDTEGVIGPFKKRKQKVVFVPGNWDSSMESELLSHVYGIKNIDNYYVTYKDNAIIGIGSPDFQLSLDERKAFKNLKKNFERIKSKGKRILVSHLHAAGTKAEKTGFRGSTALRKAIDEFKPDIFIAGHIHEAEGIEELIGKTKVFQIGEKGKIIVI